MNKRDFDFIRDLQARVKSYNDSHKQIKLDLYDSFNIGLDRYDYKVDVRSCLQLTEKNQRSIHKAITLANSLNKLIYDCGYSVTLCKCSYLYVESF